MTRQCCMDCIFCWKKSKKFEKKSKKKSKKKNSKKNFEKKIEKNSEKSKKLLTNMGPKIFGHQFLASSKTKLKHTKFSGIFNRSQPRRH